jgi:hypothetical protein
MRSLAVVFGAIALLVVGSVAAHALTPGTIGRAPILAAQTPVLPNPTPPAAVKDGTAPFAGPAELQPWWAPWDGVLLAPAAPDVRPGTAQAVLVANSGRKPAVRAGQTGSAPATGTPGAVLQASPAVAPFAGELLIADAGNNRLLTVTPAGQIVWSFPQPGSLAAGQSFHYPDDAFFTPDGRHIAVNEEFNHTVTVITFPEGKVVWQYGVPGVRGHDLRHFDTPDDAHLLPDPQGASGSGQVVVADIRNCRIMVIPWDQVNPRSIGSPTDCSGKPGSFAKPNGVFPLANGHLLITEIYSKQISEIDMQGQVVRSTKLPLHYPSDAFLTPRDTLIVSDYHSPGRVVEADWAGHILWSFPPPGSGERLDRPSIAFELPNPPGVSGPGNIVIADDHRHRVIVVNRQGQVLWQYGVTGVPGYGPGYLNTPDGLDLVPPAAVPLPPAPAGSASR